MDTNYHNKTTCVVRVPDIVDPGVSRPGSKPKVPAKPTDLINKIIDGLRNPTMSPTPGTGTRDINMNSIASGKDGTIDISLASGGGFSKVSLSKDGAKFTMGTPAYFLDSPGITTQNVLEFEIDFKDLTPKRHAQLIDELKTSLQDASGEPSNKAEAALIEEALSILDTPEVNQSSAYASLMETVTDLVKELFADCPKEEVYACKDYFGSIKKPSIKEKPVSIGWSGISNPTLRDAELFDTASTVSLDVPDADHTHAARHRQSGR